MKCLLWMFIANLSCAKNKWQHTDSKKSATDLVLQSKDKNEQGQKRTTCFDLAMMKAQYLYYLLKYSIFPFWKMNKWWATKEDPPSHKRPIPFKATRTVVRQLQGLLSFPLGVKVSKCSVGN